MDSLKIAPIVIGTWALGDSYWGEQSHSDSLKTLHAALRNGFTHFDTAPAYGKGKSEQLLGQQLPENNQVSTKCFTKALPQVKKSFELSLKRLNRSKIDTFFIHWPSSKFDYAPVIEYLEEERKLGRINKVGVSNFSKDMIIRGLNYGNIDIVQNPINLFWTRELPLFNFCKNKGIITQGYSPLAQGLLTGKFTRNSPYKKNDARNHMVLFYPENLTMLYHYIDRLSDLASNEETTISKMILKWTLGKVDSVVVGCRKRNQVEELLGIRELNLSPQAHKELDNISIEVNSTLGSYINIFNHNY